VAGGSQTTVLRVIEILEELLGGELSLNHLPAVAGDQRKTGADTTRARRDLGYEPATSLEQGLARQLEAQRATRVTNPS
jgi:UDP-glucuronate 4-epimerase